MDIKLNQIYRVTHIRKGTFVALITNVGGNFADCVILEGRARYVSVGNNLAGRGYVGDTLRLPFKFCTFEEYDG